MFVGDLCPHKKILYGNRGKIPQKKNGILPDGRKSICVHIISGILQMGVYRRIDNKLEAPAHDQKTTRQKIHGPASLRGEAESGRS
jgi:hypothetical protein